MKYVREVFEVFHITSNKSRWESTRRYKNYWWISNYGRVKITYNYKDDVHFPLLPETGGHSKDGQRYHAISVNDAHEKYVHRLVAHYFVDNPDPERFTHVHHIDHNKSNNRWDNLEWTTNEQNMRYYHEYRREQLSNEQD